MLSVLCPFTMTFDSALGLEKSCTDMCSIIPMMQYDNYDAVEAVKQFDLRLTPSLTTREMVWHPPLLLNLLA